MMRIKALKMVIIQDRAMYKHVEIAEIFAVFLRLPRVVFQHFKKKELSLTSTPGAVRVAFQSIVRSTIQ